MNSWFKSSSASVIGYVTLIVLLTAGAAQSLEGTNTVDTFDIINGQVFGSDIHDGTVKTADVSNNSLTGADIDESTLALPKIHTTTVNENGSKANGVGTPAKGGTGLYTVDYNFSVTDCVGLTNTGANFTGASSGALGTAGKVTVPNGSDTITLTFVDSAGDPRDTAFFVTLICS